MRKGKGKKLSRQRNKHHQQQQLPPAAPPIEHFRPNPNPQLSAADIQAQHGKFADKFRDTSCFDKLTKLIKTNISSHVPIKRAVCLGLGAFDPKDGSWDLKRKSHIQLAAFLTMVDIFGMYILNQLSPVTTASLTPTQQKKPIKTLSASTRNPALPSQTRPSSLLWAAKSSTRPVHTISSTVPLSSMVCISTVKFGLRRWRSSYRAYSSVLRGMSGNCKAAVCHFLFFLAFCRGFSAFIIFAVRGKIVLANTSVTDTQVPKRALTSGEFATWTLLLTSFPFRTMTDLPSFRLVSTGKQHQTQTKPRPMLRRSQKRHHQRHLAVV